MTGPTFDEAINCPTGHRIRTDTIEFTEVFQSEMLPAIRAATEIGRAALGEEGLPLEEALFVLTSFLTDVEAAFLSKAEPPVTGCQCGAESDLGLRSEMLNMVWPVNMRQSHLSLVEP